MGKAYDGKKRWTETVLQTTSAAATGNGARGLKKRYSGRTVKLSKAMRNVDAETRAIVRNARLDALEADNYGEDDALAGDGVDAQDDLYVDEDANDPEAKGGKSKKTKAKTVAKTKSKTKRWKVKSLAQLVFEEHGHGDSTVSSTTTTPTYLTVAAAPSTHPARKFCVVCGFFAAYQCRRCGSRYCRVKCGDQHQESGCLKFGL